MIKRTWLSIFLLCTLFYIATAKATIPATWIQTFHFGTLPPGALELQTTYRSQNNPDRHVLLCLEHWARLAQKFSAMTELSFSIDGHLLLVGKPNHYSKKRVGANVVEKLIYDVPLETIDKLAHAHTIEGHLGSKAFRFSAKQVLTLHQFSEKINPP